MHRLFHIAFVAGFSACAAVALADGFLVANDGRKRIDLYNLDGTFNRVWASDVSSPMRGVWGMTKGPDGNVYVASNDNSKIMKFRADGTYLSTLALGGPAYVGPTALRFHTDGDLYVCWGTSGRVSRYNGSSFAHVRDLNVSTANLTIPAGMLFRDNGQLLVAAYGNGAVRRYSPNAQSDAFGTHISDPAGLGTPFGPSAMLYTPDRASILVCAWGTNAIRKYNANTGQFQSVFASGGGLTGPIGMAWHPDGGLLVSSFSSNQVLKFTATGAFESVWSTGGDLATPYELLLIPTPATLGLLAPLAFMRRRSRAT